MILVDQNYIFTQRKGDAWYKQNENYLNASDRASLSQNAAYLCHALFPFRECINNVLEIGSSSDLKLETISHQFDAVAVDAGNR